MEIQKIFAIIALVVWIIVLLLFQREKMSFLKFIVGVVGGFVFTLLFGKVFLENTVTALNLNIMALLTSGSEIVNVYSFENAVTIFKGENVFSYFITYECSGLIEMLVFSNILLFYPIHVNNLGKKLSIMFMGIVYILLANVVRLLLMGGIVLLFGVGSYYIAHVIIARIFFIGMNVLLYYFVFTLQHVKQQKAGDYTVGRNIT